MVGTVAALPKGQEGAGEGEGAEAGMRVAKRQRRGKKAVGGQGGGSARHPDAHKGKDWILKKKDQYRQKGKEVATDSKYTGRKRPRAF